MMISFLKSIYRLNKRKDNLINDFVQTIAKINKFKPNVLSPKEFVDFGFGKANAESQGEFPDKRTFVASIPYITGIPEEFNLNKRSLEFQT